MDNVKRLLLGMFALCMSITFSILVMIKGWGLEPKSWMWILVINFISHIFAQLILEVAKHKGD